MSKCNKKYWDCSDLWLWGISNKRQGLLCTPDSFITFILYVIFLFTIHTLQVTYMYYTGRFSFSYSIFFCILYEKYWLGTTLFLFAGWYKAIICLAILQSQKRTEYKVWLWFYSLISQSLHLNSLQFACMMFRMILKYLIPVKLSIGIIPKDDLLHKYNLHEVKQLTIYSFFLFSLNSLSELKSFS